MLDSKKTFSDLNDEKEKYFEDAEKNLKKPITWKDGLKNLASSALSTLGNSLFTGAISLLGEKAISLAFEGINYLIHKDDIAIEKGQEAKETIAQQTEEYQNQKKTLGELTASYERLSKGVRITGNSIKNINLSDSDYQDFLETTNSIADIAPSLVQSWDSEGNAILKAGTNVSDLNKQVSDYLTLQRNLVHYNTKENIQTQYEGIISQSKLNQEEIDDYQKQIDKTQEKITSLEDAQEALKSQNGIQTLFLDADSGEALIKELDGIDGYIGSWEENGKVEISLDTDKIDVKKLQDISGILQGFKEQEERINEEAKINLQSVQSLDKQNWSNILPSIQTLATTSSLFDEWDDQELASEFQSKISSIFSNLDYETVSNVLKKSGKNVYDWTMEDIINPLANATEDQQKIWQQLFEFEPQENESISAVAKRRDAILEQIAAFSENDFWTKSTLAKAFGFAYTGEDGKTTWYNQEQLDLMEQAMSDATDVREWMKGLNTEDFNLVVKIRTSGDEKALANIDTLKSALEEAKIAAAEAAEKEKYSLSNMQQNVSSAQTALSSFSSVLSETTSAGGVSADNIKILNDAFKDLENADLSTLFANTSDGVKLNIDSLKQLTEQQNKIKSSDFAKAIQLQKQAIEDYKKGTDIAAESTDEYKKTLQGMEDDLLSLQQAQSQYLALAKQQQELFSGYSTWQRATQTANAGDKYTSMLSGLKSAKDAYDKGLVGTDDFKTYAALISPTGATDAENFAENYAKATRYLTDSDKGVKNFLADLNTKGLAEFNEETKQWTYNVKDMAKASETLGISQEFMSAMFGRLEDYGFHNNFISSLEEGQSHLQEVTDKLAKAQRELAQLEAQGANTSAIEAKRKEVNGYIEDVKQSQENLSGFEQTYTGNLVQQKQEAKATIESLQKEISKVEADPSLFGGNADGYINSLKQQIKSVAQDADLKLTADLYVDENALQKQIDQLGIGTWETPIDIEFEKGSADAHNYASALEKVKQAHDDNSESMQNSLDVLSNYTAEELRGIKLGNGEYDTEGLEDAEDALQAIADQTGLSTEEAMQLVNVLQAVGALKIDPDTSGLDTLTEKEQDGLDKLREMKREGKISVDINANLTEMSDEELGQRFNDLMIIRARLEPDTAEYDAVCALIEQVELQQKINMVFDKANGDEEYLQELLNSDEKLSLECGIDLEDNDAAEKLATIKAGLQSLQETANNTVSIKMDDDQFNQLIEAQSVVTIDASTEEGKKKVDDLLTYAKEQTGTTNVDANTDPALESLSELVGTINTTSADITVGAEASGVTNAITGALSGPFSIDVNARVHGLPGEATQATGTMISPARASGTAYNVLNMKALSSGNVVLSQNERALVNEEQINGHSESIVRNGRWFLLPGGAHFENLKKGDLVFNAQQTDDLLRHGKTPGHARAYASGTLSNAYASGTNANRGSGGFSAGAAGKELNSSSESTKKNTSSVNSNTNATDKNTEAVKKSTQEFNWVEKRLNYFARKTKEIADTITDYVTSAFKESQLKKQIASVSKEIEANKNGYSAYTKKAASVAKKYEYEDDNGKTQTISIPSKYRKLVKQGAWRIEDMDTSTAEGKALAEAIQSYEDWYNKALDCKDAVTELRNTQLELFEDLVNIPAEEAEKKINKLTASYQGLEAIQARLSASTKGGSTQAQLKQIMDSDVDTAYANMTSAQNKLNSTKFAQSSANSTLASAKKSLSKTKLTKAQKKAIKDGKAVDTKGMSKAQKKKAEAYNKAVKAKATADKNVASAQQDLNLKSSAYNTLSSNRDNALSAYNSGDSLSYMNSLVESELANQAEQKAAQVEAYQKSTQNYNDTKATSDANKIALNKAKKAVTTKGSAIVKKYSKKLSAAQKSALNSGKKVSTKGITDKNLLKQLEDYNKKVEAATKASDTYSQSVQEVTIAQKAMDESAQNVATSEAELAQATVEAEQTKFDNIKNYYDQQIEYRNNLKEQNQKDMELAQAYGKYINSSDYDIQISETSTMLKLAQEEAKKLQDQLNSSVDSGVIIKGSEEWLEMKLQIQDVENSVKDYGIELENLNQQQISAKYEEMFDRAIKKAEQFMDKLETINGLITDEMMYDYETGQLTEMGALSLVLNSKELDNNIKNLQTYVKKRQQIINDYNAGKYGEDTFNQKLEEAESAINSYVSAADSARKKILDIVKNQSKAELDAMQKVIDKRKEALQTKKEYADYDRTLKKSNKEINALKAEIAALEGVTTAEAKAQKARLEAQLAEKEDDLKETIQDHIYELQVSGLDKLSDQLNENYEKYVNELSSNLEKMTEVITDAVNVTANNTAQALQLMAKLLEPYGISVEDLGLEGFASGTKSVPRTGMYLTGEEGRELRVTKDGVITVLDKGDGVVPNNLTEKLYGLAENYNQIMNGTIPNVNTTTKSGDINVHYGSLLTVNGDVTRATLPDLQTILKQACDYTTKEWTKDLHKFGH